MATTSRALVWRGPSRSEEHTSELQSRRDLVCRLLLEKKKGNLTAFRPSPRVSARTVSISPMNVISVRDVQLATPLTITNPPICNILLAVWLDRAFYPL